MIFYLIIYFLIGLLINTLATSYIQQKNPELLPTDLNDHIGWFLFSGVLWFLFVGVFLYKLYKGEDSHDN